ncbi:helix-turn-helix domain-containing protein [Parasedimentitalea psychrophila]|uniref:Short-chain fatty acyl-CoA regulator family protein n=1 Tax=Parasedimentitalea psychrophila TaxID=2997337 RepID=A0A9Y2L083_9RHOB|nr:helix-turn-helix transcriptional regulator [Parasedimentitalea psychrophila]WIY25281.1 short-chain fatty acyl-CoA regulator family protein [Parasedimentitalea psychrophila]
MARDTLTGSRIRERRLFLDLRQAALARQVDISASYLNLIEHNRRRIGGKLLVDIAKALAVEPSMLTEGAEVALISALREAAADSGKPVAELDHADEFAGRFPGWAEVLAGEHRRVASLERTVQVLSDRLTHDPHLAASLHEVLSTAASIRSTASILAETGELEQEWRDRFHRNLNEDSRRLAESSKSLVSFLDQSNSGSVRRGVPQEEVEAFFTAHDYHFSSLEQGQASPEDLVAASAELQSDAARSTALSALKQYRADAEKMPLAAIALSLSRGFDPARLATEFHSDLPQVLRRLAALPEAVLGQPCGLVICDASGAVLLRKPIAGFSLPRFGAACPLWPLYAALARPLVPLRRQVIQHGRHAAGFDCLAIAWPQTPPDFDRDPVYRAVMLILPLAAVPVTPLAVGSNCRVCAGRDCVARREPSILDEEF